jgi:CRISPR-associated exonuclease Cas4
MSDQLMITLQTALQQLAAQHTTETLGNRSSYLGASDIASCPRKTILNKLNTPESDLVTLLRFRRGHMAEEIVAAAFASAGFTNFQRQVEVRHAGAVPVMAHLDFVFISEARKTMAVLEVKSSENIPEHPYGAWETQLYLQMGLLSDSYPDYTVEKGAILVVNFGKQGMQLFGGYSPQTTIYQGLMDRATNIWNQYQQYSDGGLSTPTMEIGPLCGYCPFLADCPKFEAEEVQELTESVGILTELQHQQRDLEAEISMRKSDLLAIVAQRGPLKAHGQLLRKAVRSRKVLDTDRLGQFLEGYGQSLADFQKSSSYSFLEIKKAA